MAVTTANSLLRVAEAIYDDDTIAVDQPSVINPNGLIRRHAQADRCCPHAAGFSK
jgi:hypothetical protein